MSAVVKKVLVVLVGVAAVVAFEMAFRVRPSPEARAAVVLRTLGEVQAIHAHVSLASAGASADVRGVARFGADDRIATDAEGRARMRLDDGTRVILDRSTSVRAASGELTLDGGRLFVQGAAGARGKVAVGGVTVEVGAATVAVTRADETSFYCASGEAIARGAGAGDVHIRSGETARIVDGALVVAPEKAFNDWTYGMARPWSSSGKPRGAVGELWGKLEGVPEDAGAPLAIRSHEVSVTVAGEVAMTEARTTYFNAGSGAVVGDFRMAIPRDAIVSAFAEGPADPLAPAAVRIASDTGGDANAARLEWAGEGWLRGKTRPIPPGRVEVVVVRYVEWLSHDGDRMTYRYPMLSEGAPPLLGEFHATIDAGGVDATAIAVSSGMQVVGSSIELRRADFRPASDLVVDFRLRPGALPPTRGYVVPGDSAGSYLLVRSDVGPGRARPVSEPAGVSLALVVDTSRSVGPALLDAERALVLALLEGLGAQDQVVVFAADDRARPLGPETLGPVDAARRKDIQRALSELKPGGATNLGVALERAAGALPGDQPSSTLLYLGDGWPTLGDVSVEALRARLARRSGGLPRLGAIAVGPTANRFGLTALVRGAGPVLSLGDASDAPEVAVHLLAEAMRPAHVGVSVDLGPGAERVYPRGGRTLQDGETLTTVARLRSAPPGSVVLRYADGAGEIREARPLAVRRIEDDGDIRRRWSAGRVLELMLRGGGREAIVDAALANGLLTPWTGFAAVPAGQPYRATALSARMLDAGLDGGLAVFSAGFSTARPAAGALRVAADAPWPEVAAAGAEADAWKRAAAAAARRKLDESLGLVRQCRESRATLRPEVGGILRVELSVSSDGHVASVAVKGASAFEDDAALDRCVELVVKNLGFWGAGSGGAVSVSYEFRLPPGHEVTARACSPTSLLPLPMRRGVWFERLARPETEKNPLGSHGELAYLRAKATCEMPAWSDRRTFLELLLDRAPNGVARAELAARLDEAGDPDAADLARREAVRRAESPEALESIRAVMLANEPDVSVPFVAAYAEARTDEARLATVQRFLRFAPHDSRLLRKELWLLLALGRKDDVLAESVAIRGEPFLDVALLADTASVLRRVGAEDEALRTFGELAERAPDVPFVRALVGDRLADEGLYEEAEAAYEALLRLVPDDGAAELRLALAAAGAGRLDLATRTLSHVAETGGRGSDATISELARMVSSARVALRRGKENDAVVMARLTRRAAELASSDGLGTVLVEGPTWVPGLRVKIERAGSREELTPLRTPLLGLVGLRTERGLGPLRFVLGRQRDLEPARPATVRVEVLVPADGGARLASRDVPLRADGEDTEVVWDGAAFVASAPAAHAPAP